MSVRECPCSCSARSLGFYFVVLEQCLRPFYIEINTLSGIVRYLVCIKLIYIPINVPIRQRSYSHNDCIILYSPGDKIVLCVVYLRKYLIYMPYMYVCVCVHQCHPYNIANMFLCNHIRHHCECYTYLNILLYPLRCDR